MVVLNKEAFRTEILRQLPNSDFYQPLSCDPTAQLAQEMKYFLSKALNDQLISKDEFEFIINHALTYSCR